MSRRRGKALEVLPITALLLIGLSSAVAATGRPGADRRHGVSTEKKLPLHWSTNENVRWRVHCGTRQLNTCNLGQPVFVTQAIVKENRRTLMCFDRRDGKLLWQAGTTSTVKDSGGGANPPCTPSPVTDGKRVIAWFARGDLLLRPGWAELWRRDLGRQSHGWATLLHRSSTGTCAC